VTVAGGIVVSDVEALGVETVGVVAGAGAGVGDVAMVAGAPQATSASYRRTSGDDNDFMGDPG